ncbi:hypothetical protein Q8F55_008926 [Vanrija albida]|uniref:Uncharacterized protein n=1 Tax=Vanrija albida TaxID=181172 RepID=A0ABR3PS70_9TREE
METRDDNSARPREIADNTLDTAALSTRLNALVSDKSPLPLLGSPFRTPALALRGLSRPQSIYPSDSISMIRSRTGGTDVDRGEGEEGFYDGAAYELDSQGVTNGPGVDLGAPSPVPTLPGWPGTVPENMYNHRERLTDDAVRDVLEIVQRRADEAELADAAARLDRAEKKLRDTQARLVAEQLLRGEAERASRSRGDEARCAKAELANAVRALRKARDEGRKTDEERRRATRAFDEARDRLNKYHEELRMRDARAEGKAEGRAEAEWWLGPAKSAPVRVWAVEPKAAVPLSQVPQRPTVAQEYQAQVQHPGIQQQWQVSQQPPQVPVHAQAQYGQNLDYYQPPTQYAPGVQPAQRPTVAQYAHAPQTTAQPSTRTAEPQYPSTRPSSERVPPPPALPAGISLPPDVPPPPSRLPTAPSRGSSAIIAPIPERAPRPGAAEAYLDQLVNDPRASKLLDAGLARAASKLLDTELARSATKLLDTDLGRSATKLLGTEVERSASRATQLLDTELACSASHSSRAPHRRAASASAAQFDEAWPAPGGTATPAPPTHARSASQPESTLQSHRLDHPSLHPHLHRDTASNLDSRYPLFVPSQPASSVPSRARDHSTSAPDPVQRRNSTFNPALVPLPASSVGSGVSRAKSARSATRERIAGAIRDNADLDPALHKIDETDEPAYDPRTQLPGAYPSRSYDPPKPPKARPHVGSRPRLSTVHEDEYVQRQSHRAADTDPAESSPRMASEAPTPPVGDSRKPSFWTWLLYCDEDASGYAAAYPSANTSAIASANSSADSSAISSAITSTDTSPNSSTLSAAHHRLRDIQAPTSESSR